jgi:hypothetical protein
LEYALASIRICPRIINVWNKYIHPPFTYDRVFLRSAMSARLPIPMELIQGKDIVRTGSRSLVSNLTYSHQKTTKTQQKVIFIVFHLSPFYFPSRTDYHGSEPITLVHKIVSTTGVVSKPSKRTLLFTIFLLIRFFSCLL